MCGIVLWYKRVRDQRELEGSLEGKDFNLKVRTDCA